MILLYLIYILLIIKIINILNNVNTFKRKRIYYKYLFIIYTFIINIKVFLYIYI